MACRRFVVLVYINPRKYVLCSEIRAHYYHSCVRNMLYKTIDCDARIGEDEQQCSEGVPPLIRRGVKDCRARHCGNYYDVYRTAYLLNVVVYATNNKRTEYYDHKQQQSQ